MSGRLSSTPLARGLLRVGEDGINPGDDAVLDAYFADDYVFHGPDGDADLAGLKALWAGWRDAFTDFSITREQIVNEGDLIGARNTFSGRFDRPLHDARVGEIRPNGARIALEVINTFRYHADGRLAEEWVQYDNLSFYRQLGVKVSFAAP